MSKLGRDSRDWACIGVLGLLTLASPVHADGTGAHCQVRDPDLRGSYRGDCRDGWAHGRGEAQGQASYTGEFRDGYMHGWGRWRQANGDQYVGHFADGLPHGGGTYRWEANPALRGNRYAGEFRHGKRHGQGVLLTAAGDRYEGVWKDDARAGPTATEIQFQWQYDVMSRAIEPGSTVCRDMAFGIGAVVTVKGTVQTKRGGLLTIRVDPGHGALALPEVLKNQGVMAWTLCS